MLLIVEIRVYKSQNVTKVYMLNTSLKDKNRVVLKLDC